MIYKLEAAGPQRPDTGSDRTNRRSCSRYGFAANLKYRVVSQGLDASGGTGRTIDLSAGGMLVEFNESVPYSGGVKLVELAIEWPGLYHGSQHSELLVQGQLLRSSGRRGAIRILRHEFRTTGRKRAVA